MVNFPSLWSSSFPEERQDPFRAMARMRREMDDLFQNFLSGSVDTDFQALSGIEDKDSHFLVSFDVPGMGKDDIKIEMNGNQLHVYGERDQERGGKKGSRYERSYGYFDRWLTLPQNAKQEGVEARLENGVLQLAIPKAEVTVSQQIKIGEGKSGIFSKLLPKREEKAA